MNKKDKKMIECVLAYIVSQPSTENECAEFVEEVSMCEISIDEFHEWITYYDGK